MSSVSKNVALNPKNLQIITIQGTKIGGDDPQVTMIQRKWCDYPNPLNKKEIFNNATKIFTQIDSKENNAENRNKTLNELLQLLTKEENGCMTN